ncbi:Vacuolar protein sorting-associated protein 20 [Borealophlyctis nickersoniae]|nr:Vacuolar protein sorting-associated protein 20 [Borealophlyctis nickersoniae]
MGNLISKDKNGRKVTTKDKAILDLKIQRDKLKQYQKKIHTVLDREVEVAKHHLRQGDQGRALLALKKKKYQERLLAQTDQQLLNLEQLTGQIEYALVEQDIMRGLAQGNEVLKEIHKEMSLDAVQKLMDDTADAIAYQAEIDELISGKITEEDEEEIMAQLDAFIEEEAASKLPTVPNKSLPETGEKVQMVAGEILDLPAVPDGPLPQLEEDLVSPLECRSHTDTIEPQPELAQKRTKNAVRKEEPIAA